MTALQLDLFGAVLSAEQQRHIGALTCLRDSVPQALEHVVELRYTQPTDTRAPHASGNWAYCACRAGLRFEAADEWWNGAHDRGEVWGWDRTPANLITWDELSALIGQDARRADIAAWVNTLPMPRWQLLTRPKELWPEPDRWHISHFCRDHVHEHWSGRRHAWQLTLDLLTDAITKAGAS